MTEDIYNTEERKKKESAEAKRTREKELSDLRRILRTSEGRRFVWRLWSRCGIFRNPFNPNSNQHSFNSGRMSVGQELLNDVNSAEVSAFQRIQNEQLSILESKKQAKEAQDG